MGYGWSRLASSWAGRFVPDDGAALAAVDDELGGVRVAVSAVVAGGLGADGFGVVVVRLAADRVRLELELGFLVADAAGPAVAELVDELRVGVKG